MFLVHLCIVQLNISSNWSDVRSASDEMDIDEERSPEEQRLLDERREMFMNLVSAAIWATECADRSFIGTDKKYNTISLCMLWIYFNPLCMIVVIFSISLCSKCLNLNCNALNINIPTCSPDSVLPWYYCTKHMACLNYLINIIRIGLYCAKVHLRLSKVF